jgi:hypothetical protein
MSSSTIPDIIPKQSISSEVNIVAERGIFVLSSTHHNHLNHPKGFTMPKNLFTKSAAAKRLKVSEGFITNLIEAGHLETISATDAAKHEQITQEAVTA